MLKWIWTATATILSTILAISWIVLGMGHNAHAMLQGVDRFLLVEERVLVGHPISTSGHVSRSGLPQGLVLGYFYDSPTDPSAVSFLNPYAKVLSGIIPFWYTVESNGAITGKSNPAVLSWARQHHLYTFALVTNMAGASVFSPLLASARAERTCIQNLLTMVSVNGYDGVNLDWEGIAPGDRGAFSAFVKELAAVFHRHGYYVTLSVPAETANEPANGWTGAYDYRALGRYADLLMIMAYDQHNEESAPGPVASAAWVTEVLKYAVSAVPGSKIILGVPGYGYEWSPAGNAALTWYQAEQLAHQFGQSAQSGHFVYVSAGKVHTVYFENTETFLQKMRLVTGFEVRGLALWRLGIEDPQIWGYLG